ncbi:MAG: ABC transporter substrate-binding protein, partial [bacterium]
YPPVGTGPFKFVEWVKDDHITLERNPDYWGEKAKVEKVIIKTIPDNSARFLALKTGEIMGMDGANPDDVISAKNDPNIQILLRPALNVGWLNFNVTVKPFDDVRVRKAIAMAIDKKTIVQTLFGETGIVADQIWPPFGWGHNFELQDYPYDPEGAKALLAEAGYPDGFETDFWYMPNPRPYYPDPKGIAEAIAADLGKVGVRCNLKTEDWTTYLADRRDGKFNFWMLGWTGDNGDPDNFLFFHYGVPRPGEGNYNNPELIKILTDAQKVVNQAQRAELYKQAAVIIHEDCPRLFIGHNQVPLLFSKKVTGYVVNPTSTEIYNTVVLLP